MKSDKPFRKAFVCGGVLYVFVLLLYWVAGAPVTAYRAGRLLAGVWLMPGLAAGLCGYFSKRPWDWAKFAIVVIGFMLLFLLVMASGQSAQR